MNANTQTIYHSGVWNRNQITRRDGQASEREPCYVRTFPLGSNHHFMVFSHVIWKVDPCMGSHFKNGIWSYAGPVYDHMSQIIRRKSYMVIICSQIICEQLFKSYMIKPYIVIIYGRRRSMNFGVQTPRKSIKISVLNERIDVREWGTEGTLGTEILVTT